MQCTQEAPKPSLYKKEPSSSKTRVGITRNPKKPLGADANAPSAANDMWRNGPKTALTMIERGKPSPCLIATKTLG